MIKLQKLYDALDALAPFEMSEPWDNAGLLLGSMHDEISALFFTLDITGEIIDEIVKYKKEASIKGKVALIAHHPPIFTPLRALVLDAYPASLLSRCIINDIDIIATHTNFDKAYLNLALYESLSKGLGVGIDDISELGDFVLASKNTSKLCIEEILEGVASLLGTREIVYSLGASLKSRPKSIAFGCGASASFGKKLPRDSLLIGGDLKHHDALEAREAGVSIIDVGHHGSERGFGGLCARLLAIDARYHESLARRLETIKQARKLEDKLQIYNIKAIILHDKKVLHHLDTQETQQKG